MGSPRPPRERHRPVFQLHQHPVAMSTLFQCPVGVLSHLPAAVRPGVGDALTLLLRKVAHEPSEVATWALMAFPKLVLRASARGGKKHTADVVTEVNRRLHLWRSGQWATLWEEATASSKQVNSGPTTRSRTAGLAVTEATCRRLRRMVGEGAP